MFDTTKPSVQQRAERRVPVGALLRVPGVITPATISWFLASVALFVVGYIGTPDGYVHTRAFWISIALRATALAMFVVALVQTRATTITVNPTELICKREVRRTVRISRAGLSLHVEPDTSWPRWRPAYVVVARSNDQRIVIATVLTVEQANVVVDTINETLAQVRPSA